MQLLLVFLSCLFLSQIPFISKLQASAHMPDDKDRELAISSTLPSNKVPPLVIDATQDEPSWTMVTPTHQETIPSDVAASPVINVNSLMRGVVAYYCSNSSLCGLRVAGAGDWHSQYLKDAWEYGTAQKINVKVVRFVADTIAQLKEVRESIISLAFLVGMMQGACCQDDACIKDVAASIEESAGFKCGEFRAITPKSLATNLIYAHNWLMVIGRFMGYQMMKKAEVKTALTAIKKVYEKNTIASLIQEHRNSDSINLEALFTSISQRLRPLYPLFEELFAKQQDSDREDFEMI